MPFKSDTQGNGESVAERLTNVFSASNTALTSLAIGFAIAATEVSRYTALWTTSLVDVPAKYPVLMIFLAIGIAAVVLIGQRAGDTLTVIRPRASPSHSQGQPEQSLAGFA